ncbi:MAG: AIR synthase-related protein [bacterium]|nr:AIR synthase-related protein [bacterium]
MKIGKVSESVLKRSVLRQIGTEREEAADSAGLGKDCAVFSFPLHGTAVCGSEEDDSVKQDLMTCMQEGSLTFCDGEHSSPMERLIQKCANNLAAGGARMAWAMIALILPEEAQEADLKELMRQAGEKCRQLGVRTAGGQTRVSPAVKHPVAVITGYGVPFAERARRRDAEGIKADSGSCPKKDRKAAPGQDVVISKWIGLEGTARLAVRNREKLKERYPARFVEEAVAFDRFLSVIPEAATAVKSGVCAMHDASEGGILGALWELAERAGVGLTIDLRKLPLRQETVEVCELCHANPYELLSGGSLLMTAWDGPKLAAALEEEGIPAVVVGKITDSHDRILINEDEVRYLGRPKQDEIYRLL